MTFQIIAISSLLASYGCYLGKMLLQKKQGIQTDQQAPTVPDRCALQLNLRQRIRKRIIHRLILLLS